MYPYEIKDIKCKLIYLILICNMLTEVFIKQTKNDQMKKHTKITFARTLSFYSLLILTL